MATSGRLQGNGLNIGGRGDNYVFINWQLAGQNIGGNYSTINWQMYFHFNGADAQLDNGYADVGDGARRYANGGRVYNFSNNFSTRDLGITSGSFNWGHNAQGNATLYVASGMTAYQSGRSEAGARWDLPTIPRDAFLTNLSQDITDADNPWVEFSNAGGFAVNTWFEFPNNAGVPRLHQRNNVGSRFTWLLTEAERAVMRSYIPNQNAVTIRYVIETDKGSGGYGYDYRDRTYTIVGDRNPTFTDFDYKDTNTAITAVTGNPLVLVQNKSTLQMTIPTTKKMVANKQSTPVDYVSTMDGTVKTNTHSNTASMVAEMGSVAGTGSKTLSVRANDSRGNSTTVSKAIEVVPYATPDIEYVANRQNNFEATTEIKINGSFSPLLIDGTNKNSIVPASLMYRKRQDGGTWGSWTPVTFSQSAGSFTAPLIYENLLNSSVFDFEVKISDKLETAVETFTVDRGVPIFMISDTERIGVNRMPDPAGRKGMYLTKDDNLWLQLYAIGDIYMTMNTIDPATRFGGTWVLEFVGRNPVGIDTSDTDFNTIGKTGGQKTVQAHNHTAPRGNDNNLGGGYGWQATDDAYDAYPTSTAGTGATNMNPYKVCYFWRRTA